MIRTVKHTSNNRLKNIRHLCSNRMWMVGLSFIAERFALVSSELYGKHARNLMKTDVRELDGSYELDVDLPGFKKDEVTVDLQDGYLTISAAKGLDKDESDKKGKFLRQERYAGSMSRSFYVGDDVESADVSAKFEDGILKISVPKAAPKELPKHTTITIE